ncbi:MAG: hypothetical protein U1E73_04200 [Planctomycetota bacterium]
MTTAAGRSPQRVAAGWFLFFAAIGAVALLAMRGLLRPLLPVLVLAAVVWGVGRVVRALKAPPPP